MDLSMVLRPIASVVDTALPGMKCRLQLSLTPVSPDVRSFWETLYETEIDKLPPSKVLSVGSLLHKDNLLTTKSIGEDLFVRDTYHQLYEESRSGRRHYFFTGTPGVGKSCFRTYMMWRHIQELRSTRDTGCIWASRTPRGDAPVHVLLIENGQIVDAFKVQDQNSIWVMGWLDEQKLKTFAHLDVHNEDVSNAPGKNAFTNFYYSSDNEKAWKEKCKIKGTVKCIPDWDAQEMAQYFLGLGCNGVLVRALGLEVEQQEEKEAFRLSLSSSPSSDDDVDDCRVVDIYRGESHRGQTSFNRLLQVVEREMKNFGCVPRNLFMTSSEMRNYESTVDFAIDNLDHSKALLDIPRFFRNVQHRFFTDSLDPTSGSYPDTTSRLRNFVRDKAMKRVLKNYENSIKMLYFFPGNLKAFPLMALGCFAMCPSHFRVVPLLPSASKPEGPDDTDVDGKESVGVMEKRRALENPIPDAIAPKDVKFTVDEDELFLTSVRTSREFDLRDFADDATRRGVVGPPDLHSPGMMRFEHQGTMYTAFVVSTIYEKHPVSARGIALIKALKTRAEAAAASKSQLPHKCIVMWLVGRWDEENTKSPDGELMKKLGEHIDEYIIQSVP